MILSINMSKTAAQSRKRSKTINRIPECAAGFSFAVRSFAAAAVFCVMLALSGPLTAQIANNTITGRVTDPSGAIVPGATVMATARATNLVLHGQTNSDGIYVFSQLQAGRYDVAVEAPGFKKTQTSVTLTVAQTVELDLALHVGSAASSVTVQAEGAAQLNTQDATLAYTVGSRKVSELPLNGRNPYGLAALSPGIAPGNFFGQGLSTTRGAVVAAATNNFETNGGIGGSNEVLLDGISIVVCCQGQPALTPSVEVVDQFKVITSDPPAQFGRSSGGFLNIVTKTGGNRLQGDIYEFFRNDALDAANFFTKRSGKYPFPGRNDYTLPHHFNQFGGFVSGPVFIPHVYNGKESTFFTFGYEGTRNLAPTYQTTTVPTALMRQGIFTEAPDLVYDPNNVAPDPANPGQYTRQPIPAACNGSTCYPAGQYIPNIDPVAQKTLPLIPSPNAPGVANNFNYATNIIDTENQLNFRVDHNFSANQRTFIRGSRDTDQHQNYGYFNKPGDPTGWTQSLTSYLFALGHVWTVSPSLLLQFNYGFANQKNYQIGNGFYNFNAKNYGYSNLFTTQQQIPGIPYLNFTGLAAGGSTLGSGFNLWDHYTHSLNAIGILQHGNQLFTFGYSGQMILENQGGLGNPSGTFNFTPTFTSGPNPNATVPSAQSAFDSWASFLLGYPSSGGLTRQETVAFNQFYNALFLQDDWRILPKLTLNLGLRWNIETGFKERHNRWADFNPSVANPLSAYTGLPFTGGAQYLGVSGNPSRTWPTTNKFAPRAGFAYELAPTTVVRGGFSIMYLPTSERGFGDSTIGYSQSTPYVATINGRTPVNTVDNPFPSGVLLPQGSAAGVDVGAGSSVSAFVYHNPVSYQQQWNFGVEQSLPKGMVFSLNYAGSHGVHLPLNWRPNDLNPKYFGAPGDQTQVAYLQTLVSNPFYGSSATGTLASPTVQRAQLLAAFPQYTPNTGMQNGSLTYLKQDVGSASYNALQAVLAVNRPNGLSGTLAYTWSKLIGNVSDLTTGFLNPSGNPGIQDFYLLRQYERSILATDIPQRVVGNAIYPLPLGRGRQFGSNIPRWANVLAGGWTLTTIISVQSGFPLGLTQTGSEYFSGSRPSFVPGVNPLTSGSNHQRLGGKGQTQGYLNPAAFRRSRSFELGDVPRSAGAIRSPISFEDDASAIKDFAISRDFQVQFRLEAFNVLNKVQFGAPNTTFGSAAFGYITSQQNLPRNIQAALKIYF